MEEDSVNEEQNKNDAKKRKIHLDVIQCAELSNCEAGAQALRHPTRVSTSSRDHHHGLHPRPSNRALPSSFQTARQLMNPRLPFRPAPKDDDPQLPEESIKPLFSEDSQNMGKRRNLQSQSNKLDGYFKVSGLSEKTQHSASQDSFTTTTPSSQEGLSYSPRTTKMYSPIKRTANSNTIYIVDSSPESKSPKTTSVPKATSSSQGAPSQNSDIVKKLFDGANAKPDSKTVPKKGKKLKSEPVFNRENAFLYSTDPTPATTRPKLNSEDKYGLLGSGQYPREEPAPSYFQDLPTELVHNIFCRLPMDDLWRHLRVVCHSWNEIITDNQFLPSKKMYYALLKNKESAKKNVFHLMEKSNILVEKKETMLPSLIRRYKAHRPATGCGLSEALKTHPKYKWALDLLKERFSDCMEEEMPDPWCVVVTLIVLSENVADISALIHSMLLPPSQCTAMDVIETLYSIASFLLAFKMVHYSEVWNGMHYRTYYAIYLYENDYTATVSQLSGGRAHLPGQQSLLRYASNSEVQFTHEQLRICSHELKAGEVVKIVAFAGTGKTTTLLKYVQCFPNYNYLLVVYNKAIAEHAKKVFPKSYVCCATIHSLAYQKVGFRYQTKGFPKKIRNIKLREIVDAVRNRKGLNMYTQAKLVEETLVAFKASADATIDLRHVPMEAKDANGQITYLGVEMREHMVEDSVLVWKRMCDQKDMGIPMTHDGYLKLYQLNYDQRELQKYNVIMIDEAQDITPAVADILLRQPQAKLLVGDPHQQIYSFRGAVNSMDLVTATHTFYLTQSFRFGPEIAFVAASCLEIMKGVRDKTLVGNGRMCSINGSTQGQVAIITRTNYQLFCEAVKKCCYDNTPVRAAFAGGVDSFGFDMIEDIYLLLLPPEERAKSKKQIKNSLIKKFNNFADLEKYANTTNDSELLGKIRIVKTYDHSLPSLIPKIRAKCRNSVEHAELVFSTAHKAKGLEFPTVKLADDFNAEMYPPGITGPTTRRGGADEDNLLYVAVTRAKRSLHLTPSLMRLLSIAGEQFLYPGHSATMKESGCSFKGWLTDQEFKPHALSLLRTEVTLADNKLISGGVYHPQVVLEDHPVLAPLYGALKDGRENGETLERARQAPKWTAAQWGHMEEFDIEDVFLGDF